MLGIRFENLYPMKKGFILFFLVWILGIPLNAQVIDTSGGTTIEVVNGDTVQFKTMDPVEKSLTLDKKRLEDYQKLVRKVKKVLPYAKLAAARLKVMEDNLSKITGKRARKKYIKECEESLKTMYLEQLKNLNIEEGKILMKLIYRETGNTTWEIMKKYRGSAEALMYQTMGKFYGHDMKREFDAVLDYQIENIIKVYKLE